MGNVDCGIEDGLATVTFTNPPKGFLTSAMVVQLGAIMTDLITQDERALQMMKDYVAGGHVLKKV